MDGMAHWTGEQSIAFSLLEGLRFEPGQTRTDLTGEQLDALKGVAGMEVTRQAPASEQVPAPETPQEPAAPLPEPPPAPLQETNAAG